VSRALSWREREGLRAVDVALADTLRRLADEGGSDESVLLGAALASLAVSEGHAAFDPAQPHALLEDSAGLPDAATWIAALARSPWVSTCTPTQADVATDPTRPLVLEDGRLYLRRYREYERRLAHGLRRLAAPAARACRSPSRAAGNSCANSGASARRSSVGAAGAARRRRPWASRRSYSR